MDLATSVHTNPIVWLLTCCLTRFTESSNCCKSTRPYIGHALQRASKDVVGFFTTSHSPPPTRDLSWGQNPFGPTLESFWNAEAMPLLEYCALGRP